MLCRVDLVRSLVAKTKYEIDAFCFYALHVIKIVV